MIGSADIRKAIEDVWASLDGDFRALRPAGSAASPTLSSQQAQPAGPFPYCVLELGPPTVETRMSGDESTKRELRSYSVTFNVHADRVAGDSRSARRVAYDLAERVMRLFGGHPEVAPTRLTLDNGGHVLTQYVTDWYQETDLYKAQWVVEYRLLVDVPAAMMAT